VGFLRIDDENLACGSDVPRASVPVRLRAAFNQPDHEMLVGVSRILVGDKSRVQRLNAMRAWQLIVFGPFVPVLHGLKLDAWRQMEGHRSGRFQQPQAKVADTTRSPACASSCGIPVLLRCVRRQTLNHRNVGQEVGREIVPLLQVFGGVVRNPNFAGSVFSDQDFQGQIQRGAWRR
jgi:hypothetical protein